MSLKGQLYKSIRAIPNCIAGGYIDLDSNELLAMLTVGLESKKLLSRLVGITEDLFQGPNVVLIEQFFDEARGITDREHHLFQEIVVMNDELMHTFIRGKRHPNHVITFVSENIAHMALSLEKTRKEVIKIEESLNS